MAFHSILWYFMAFYGILWHSIAFYGILWHSIAFYGILWHSMAFDGTLRYDIFEFYIVIYFAQSSCPNPKLFLTLFHHGLLLSIVLVTWSGLIPKGVLIDTIVKLDKRMSKSSLYQLTSTWNTNKQSPSAISSTYRGKDNESRLEQ